jgi:hypothetical protein
MRKMYELCNAVFGLAPILELWVLSDQRHDRVIFFLFLP